MNKHSLAGAIALIASVIFACGGGTSGATGSTSQAENADPGGVCTHYACAPAQPGDCPLAKCADYDTACAEGEMIHVRCVPDPDRGIGSAPADRCVLVGDCSNSRMPDPDGGAACDESECGAKPTSCVLGSPHILGCVRIGSATSGYCAWNYRCE